MKRITAWMMALVMLLSPVSASAVTWGEICTGLRSGNSFSKDGVKAERNEDVTTVEGGNVEDVNFWNSVPSAMVIFKDTNISGEFRVIARNGEEYIVTLEKGVTVNVENFNVGSDGEGSSMTVINRGDVTSTDLMFADSEDGGTTKVVNEGSMKAEDSWHVLANDYLRDEDAEGAKSSQVTVENKGTFIGELHGSANDTSSVTLINSGVIQGELNAQTSEKSFANVSNSGTVTGDVWGIGEGDSRFEVINSGKIQGELLSNASGDTIGRLENTGDVSGDFYGYALDNGVIAMSNSGTVGDTLVGIADDQALVYALNQGSVGVEIVGSGNDQSSIILVNQGKVGEGIFAGIEDEADVRISHTGTVGKDIHIRVEGDGSASVENGGKNADKTQLNVSLNPYANKYATMKEVYDKGSKVLAKIDVSGLTQEQIDGVAYQYVGERTHRAVYEVAMDEDGKLYLVLIEQEEEEDDGPETISKERYRHLMEEKRKEESIAGVYASPYWCRQLSLGYTNQNLWIHNAGGDKINFREKLAWLWDGTPGKRLNLRVNLDDPTGVTMRFDGTIFDTLERTEIDQLTILDKNGNVYMDYNVRELKAAREAFGLAADELLIVGGADDPVMRMGADGVIRPVEEM